MPAKGNSSVLGVAAVLSVLAASSPANGQGIIYTYVGTDWTFPGDGRPGPSAPIGTIRQIAVDPTDNTLVFVDPQNHMVMRLDREGILHVIGGTGFVGFSGDNGPATKAMLSGPLGVVVDIRGNIILSDTGNHRIRRITPAGVITTIGGSGRA